MQLSLIKTYTLYFMILAGNISEVGMSLSLIIWLIETFHPNGLSGLTEWHNHTKLTLSYWVILLAYWLVLIVVIFLLLYYWCVIVYISDPCVLIECTVVIIEKNIFIYRADTV